MVVAVPRCVQLVATFPKLDGHKRVTYRRDVDADWPVWHRRLTKTFTLTGPSQFAHLTRKDLAVMVDSHGAMQRRWDAVPMAESLTVQWPPPAATS